MIIKHIKDEADVGVIDDSISKGKHVFILVYMVGCGPCNATRPEWAKLESALKGQYANKDDVAVIDVDQNLLPHIKSIGSVEGFPTMKYISNKGTTIENYEDSGLKNTDRSVDSFINWIESKITNNVSTEKTSSPHHVVKRLSKARTANSSSHRSKGKSQKGGYGFSLSNKKGGKKWTKKYRRSINCKRPKGFSQKQYCKCGRNKHKH
jgi:Thioredoxin